MSCEFWHFTMDDLVLENKLCFNEKWMSIIFIPLLCNRYDLIVIFTVLTIIDYLITSFLASLLSVHKVRCWLANRFSHMRKSCYCIV
jgi:hypothetical protein